MDDRDDGLLVHLGRLAGCTVPLLAPILAAALVASGAGVALGADAAAVSTVKGDQVRMADAVMADRIIRYVDPSDDQLDSDGAPVRAPEWTDLEAVSVAGTKTPAKLRTKMQSDHPPGASDAFYGSEARPRAKARIIFVAVQMAARLPENARGQVVEVGIAGEAATPVQVGTGTDTRAGIERFSLSGLFRNGAIATGSTDVIGKAPGADIDDADYHGLDSGVYGFYDEKRRTWYLAIPRAGDSDVISVSVRSTTADGQVIDRLDLPGGGHFVDLREPLGGVGAKAELPRLTCRALETFSGSGGAVELSDPDSTQIRYTVGMDDSVGAAKTDQLLAPAVAAAGPVSVVLTSIGADDAPLTVDGELSLTAEGKGVLLTFEAPVGQWSFALEDELTTPTGERIVDHSTLTGPAGVRTGAGLDGYVAGDLSCFVERADEAPAEPEGTGSDDDAPEDAAPGDEAEDGA
jgi:hypothetical protein